MAVAGQLSLSHARGTGGEERAAVINLSPHGAAVVAPSYWEPNERILVRAQGGEFVTLARVVYCHRRAQGFATGLELHGSTLRWRLEPQLAA